MVIRCSFGRQNFHVSLWFVLHVHIVVDVDEGQLIHRLCCHLLEHYGFIIVVLIACELILSGSPHHQNTRGAVRRLKFSCSLSQHRSSNVVAGEALSKCDDFRPRFLVGK